MNLDDEHASFLSTIVFSPSSTSESQLTLVEPEKRHSTSSGFLGRADKSPSVRSFADSDSYSRRNHAKYGAIGNSAHLAQSLCESWIADSWLLEFAGFGLALLSLGALIITLLVYQSKALPHWKWGLTLNSLLSILSQVITWSITSAVAGALSQQKWLWFRKSTRPLKDFARFDEASNGP